MVDEDDVRLISSAARSVDLIAASWLDEPPGAPLVPMHVQLAATVRRRAIVPGAFPEWYRRAANRPQHEALETLAGYSHLFGWELRLASGPLPTNLVLVDGREALLTFRRADGLKIPARIVSDPELSLIQCQFDELWEKSETYELLYEDRLRPAVDECRRQIVTTAAAFYDELIRHLVRHPEDLRSLHPRRFEELVAELLVRQGCQVRLTPASKDTGFDVAATLQTPVGSVLCLVECKRYSEDRPVGVGLVNALFGVVERERAGAGLLVTTSRFTRGALQAQETLSAKISLRDYDGLKEWLRDVFVVAPNQRLHPTAAIEPTSGRG